MHPGDLFSRGGMGLVVSVLALCPGHQLVLLSAAIRLALCFPPSQTCGGGRGEMGPVVQRAANDVCCLGCVLQGSALSLTLNTFTSSR